MNSAEENGKRLGLLIAALDVSAQQREALLSLLPQMTETQLNELANVLEVNYLRAGTKEPDEQFISALKSTEEKYQQTVQRANANTVKELDAIA